MNPTVNFDTLVSAGTECSNFGLFGSRFSRILFKCNQLCFFNVLCSFLSIFIFFFQFVSCLVLVSLPYLDYFFQSRFSSNIIWLVSTSEDYLSEVLLNSLKINLTYLSFFFAINIDARKWLFSSLFHGLQNSLKRFLLRSISCFIISILFRGVQLSDSWIKLVLFRSSQIRIYWYINTYGKLLEVFSYLRHIEGTQ